MIAAAAGKSVAAWGELGCASLVETHSPPDRMADGGCRERRTYSMETAGCRWVVQLA